MLYLDSYIIMLSQSLWGLWNQSYSDCVNKLTYIFTFPPRRSLLVHTHPGGEWPHRTLLSTPFYAYQNRMTKSYSIAQPSTALHSQKTLSFQTRPCIVLWLTHFDSLLTDCWLMLTDADWCWLMLTKAALGWLILPLMTSLFHLQLR